MKRAGSTDGEGGGELSSGQSFLSNITKGRQPLIVALCGDSGAGKTTLTNGMVQVFGRDRIIHLCLDDYHTLDRETRLRAGITALHPDANNFALMTEHIRCQCKIIGVRVQCRKFCIDDGAFTLSCTW